MTCLLLLASNNPGKLAELRHLLSDLPVHIVTPADLGLALTVEEDGLTYAENATRKALAFARAAGVLALADDSGLEVDALDGAPGLHSARFAPFPGATDRDRRQLLLQALRQCHAPRPWRARFRATVVLADPQGQLDLAEGQCEGEIIPEERGRGGFGYDPIFLIPDLGLTMAELPLAAKNRLSHRARAVQALRPALLRRLSDLAPDP